jgi:hypothetical protein
MWVFSQPYDLQPGDRRTVILILVPKIELSLYKFIVSPLQILWLTFKQLLQQSLEKS